MRTQPIESQKAHDAAPDAAIRIWVVDVNGRALTIDVDGPPAEMSALSAEIDAILAGLAST